MDDFNFAIEGDVLFCNHIKNMEEQNVFQVTKTPIITKDVFVQCYNAWIKEGEDAKD